MGKRSSIAGSVGTGLAYVQHGLDRFYEWGFRQLKDVGSSTPTVIDSPPPSGIVARLRRVGRASAWFVGTAGDAYFHTYESLKKRSRDENDSSS